MPDERRLGRRRPGHLHRHQPERHRDHRGELLQDQRILGEKENLAPGLDPVSFTTTLGGGTYQLYCPGAGSELTDFTVTGAAADQGGSTQALLKQGARQYGGYVDTQVAAMMQSVKALQRAVDSGDLAAAQTAYADARPYYERIESDVDGFVLPGFKATDNPATSTT